MQQKILVINVVLYEDTNTLGQGRESVQFYLVECSAWSLHADGIRHRQRRGDLLRATG